jgi:threonine/homoserine efflux transporter RhtA
MPMSFRLALACAIVTACPFMLDGCALAALPCRATSAVLKIVPVVGHAASTPFDACATAID